LNELWYSDEEIGLINRMVLQDVASCSAMLTDATVDLQDRETFKAHVILCTGLDHLVSTDLPRRVRALEQMKRQHKRTIIAAQRLLRVIDPGEEDLARLSQASSQPRRDRARRVAHWPLPLKMNSKEKRHGEKKLKCELYGPILKVVR
jgi:hypothetical protein